MTSGYATDAEETPLHDTEPIDRLIGIFRTGRMESARPARYHFPKYPVIERQGLLIDANEDQNQFFHKKSLAYKRQRTTLYTASYQSGEHTIFQSHTERIMTVPIIHQQLSSSIRLSR